MTTNQKRFARLQLGKRSVHAELAEGAAWVLTEAPWLGGVRTGESFPGIAADGGLEPRGADPAETEKVKLLCPVTPSKILCVGRNYRAHAKELGNEVPAEPMLFFKPPSALTDPDGVIELPPREISARVEHEAELAVVVGKRLRHADEAEASDAIFGFTAACDVTARDLQKKDGQWWRAKGMDTFCPVGPVVVTGLDPNALTISCSVDGERRQHGQTDQMIFSVPSVLAFVSQVMTLEPGDLILTGTPEGVGPLVDGSRLVVAISSIGELRASVRGGA